MWETQPQAFLVGTALILIYQAARFSELNLADSVTARYIALLPGVKARDLAEPHAYNLALAVFLGTSFIVYFLVCQISPEVFAGAAKLFVGNFDVKKALEGVPYPLYVAAVFMGLTQPIFPGLSRVKDAQRTFFHDQIAVPRRIVDLFESLRGAIEQRAGDDKKRLADEVRKLAGSVFLKSLSSQGDVAFYKAELDKLGLGNGASETIIRASSVKELHLLIDQLVIHALVAVMRRSGPKAMADIAKSLGAEVPLQHDNALRDFLARLVAVGVPFCIGILTIAFILLWLGAPVNYLFSKDVELTLWPTTLDYVFDELLAIVPQIVACMILAVLMLVPRGTQDQDSESLRASEVPNLLNFFQANASVFGLCMLTAIVIKVAQMFPEYANLLKSTGGHSGSLLMLPVIQSFVAVTACIVTTWCLASWVHGMPRWRSLILMILLLIVGTSFVAVLYDLAFLDVYLSLNPKYKPGWEHVLFSVIANVLVTLCAFASVTVFFKAHERQRTAV